MDKLKVKIIGCTEEFYWVDSTWEPDKQEYLLALLVSCKTGYVQLQHTNNIQVVDEHIINIKEN